MNENALLRAACDVRPGASIEPCAEYDWRYLQDAAHRQGVTPLLYDWLTRHPEVAVDPLDRAMLHDAYWANHFRNRLLLAELARVREAARRLGLDLMPLKGARLAPDYYPAPALRPLCDLDFLVRPEHLQRVGELLSSIGYRQVEKPGTYIDASALDAGSSEHSFAADADGFDAQIEYRAVALELTSLQLTDLDPVVTAALRAYTADAWARARSTRMTPEDLLLHVTTHLAARHVDFRLIWLHDIARLIAGEPELDWTYVVRTSARLRAAAPVGAALQAAERWVGAAVPPEIVAQLHDAARTRPWLAIDRWNHGRLMDHVASLGDRDLRAEGPGLSPIATALGCLSGWGPRLKLLRWVALPSRAYLADRGMASTGVFGYAGASVRRYVNYGARSLGIASVSTSSAVAAKSPERSA